MDDSSGGGTTITVTPGTIARMAGNIAAGLVDRDEYREYMAASVARHAVAIARCIVAVLNEEQ